MLRSQRKQRLFGEIELQVPGHRASVGNTPLEILVLKAEHIPSGRRGRLPTVGAAGRCKEKRARFQRPRLKIAGQPTRPFRQPNRFEKVVSVWHSAGATQIVLLIITMREERSNLRFFA